MKTDFEAIADSIRSTVSTTPDDKVRRALLAWAADYDAAAKAGPTTSKGTQLVGQGAKDAGKLCGA